MSKNLTIDEGGESRHFDGVKRLKTKLAGENGGTCYWVPDDETRAWPTFIMNNGMHTAEEEGVYGFSEASVNVYIPTPFPDWDIWIDDLDIPHIHIDDITIGDWQIDDIELTIDDIDGTPIIDMDGIDMDGFDIPDIDIHMDDNGLPISDIDFATDIHVWTDENDPSKIHIKDEQTGEEIVLDYDDIDGPVNFEGLIDIDYDGTNDEWVISASTKIKVDGADYDQGDEIKRWSKDEIVDFTMKVEQEISVDFPDLDPDFDDDFDVELDLDNMELDMDGMNMDIDLPLLKMPDLDDKLPDEIRIMHVPDKTSYKDGEPIDLDGIVVQAYKGGEVWQNKKYINGYIPVHELLCDKEKAEKGLVGYSAFTCRESFDYSNAYGTYHVENLTEVSIDNTGILAPVICRENNGYIYIPIYSIGQKNTIVSKNVPTPGSSPIQNFGYRYELKDGSEIWAGTNVYVQNKNTAAQSRVENYEFEYSGGIEETEIPRSETSTFLEDLINYVLFYNNEKIVISWPRPIDGQILSASFEISIETPTTGE